MDEIQREAIDIMIFSIIKSLTADDEIGDEYELIIDAALDEICNMFDEEYQEELGEIIFFAKQELQNYIDDKESIHNIMKEIGWVSKK